MHLKKGPIAYRLHSSMAYGSPESRGQRLLIPGIVKYVALGGDLLFPPLFGSNRLLYLFITYLGFSTIKSVTTANILLVKYYSTTAVTRK